MPEKAVGSSPTSSRWVLEALVTRARLGFGRRLRESAAEDAFSGVFLRRPRSDGYPNSERSLQDVQARSDWELPSNGGHGGPTQERSVETTVVSRTTSGRQGDKRQLS
jgi:hypothetical protein